MDYRIEPEESRIRFFGRTLYDKKRAAMFFNWTASGFEMKFQGRKVEMDAVTFGDGYPGEGDNLPWLAVFLDEEAEPKTLLKLQEGTRRYTLFESDTTQIHTLRIVKRSENSKGRSGISMLSLEGELLPCTPAKPRLKLELIGDSITCGFGNDMAADETVFDTAKENGLKAYGAVAANLLDADYQCICISGIPLCWASDPAYRLILPDCPGFVPPVRSMEDFYAYADRNHEEAMGKTEGFTPWSFERFQPDAIVVNLGTNDGFRLRVSGCTSEEEAYFIQRYQAFLHQLRRLNGTKPVIACTLGSMDYYLYDAIEKAVAAYRKETGDEKIFCMKFAPIDPWNEGFGGLGHPNTKTQIRMGHELATALKPWLIGEVTL